MNSRLDELEKFCKNNNVAFAYISNKTALINGYKAPLFEPSEIEVDITSKASIGSAMNTIQYYLNMDKK